MFFLNMVDYPMFFPMLSTLTWDTFLTLRGPWGFYLNHVLPTRPSKSYGVVGWWVAHKILVTAQVLGFGIWIGLWPRACQLVRSQSMSTSLAFLQIVITSK